jgi:2-haloacid dehalogenase
MYSGHHGKTRTMTATITQARTESRTMTFRPKYITFDCYGTLTNFRMQDVARAMYADRVPAARMDAFVKDFAQYRLDEVMGDWRPYDVVLENAIRRTCRRHKVEYRDGEGRKYYDAVPTWGPHPDVSEPLTRIAKEIPLVILSNAMDEQIHHNVAKLGAPFHRVYTAQQAQAYKPRLRAFEYMLDQLGCPPEEILHVSSSMRYDHLSAADMGIHNRAFVARGHEPFNPAYGAREIPDIGGLPALVGL